MGANKGEIFRFLRSVSVHISGRNCTCVRAWEKILLPYIPLLYIWAKLYLRPFTEINPIVPYSLLLYLVATNDIRHFIGDH